MGGTKQALLEEMDEALEGFCWSCGERLSKEELDTGRDECFSCYFDREGAVKNEEGSGND